jgi:DNA-directed RNA polymerase subunit M/transcription elongation factor TFIIS
MKFCNVCDNMLYIRLEATEGNGNKLVYFCKNCGNSIDGEDTATKSCIIDTNYIDDQTTYKQFATPYITHDPTLPRVNDIACPNAECSSVAGSSAAATTPEVIYVKYDATNLKFLYHCTRCSTFWKSGAAVTADD